MLNSRPLEGFLYLHQIPPPPTLLSVLLVALRAPRIPGCESALDLALPTFGHNPSGDHPQLWISAGTSASIVKCPNLLRCFELRELEWPILSCQRRSACMLAHIKSTCTRTKWTQNGGRRGQRKPDKYLGLRWSKPQNLECHLSQCLKLIHAPLRWNSHTAGGKWKGPNQYSGCWVPPTAYGT